MDSQTFLREYFDRYRNALANESVFVQMQQLKDWLLTAQAQQRKAIFAGNGGSAAIAGHCAIDFTKQGKIRAVNFNEAGIVTCFANDYGYEHWLARAIEFYADPGDVAIMISSSGRSQNIINGARAAKAKGVKVATLTGFATDNPLRSVGDLNFWIDSRAYNIVENVHQIWLLAVCDLIIGKAEYSVT